jgi:NIMA (never in mitosis gene a)-related kinase
LVILLKNVYILKFNVFLDVLRSLLAQRNTNLIFLVEKESTKELFVMKMINIGKEGSEERNKAQREILAEINIGLTLGQECPFLVRYLEIFYHENFCCLIMEYCELGDLQKELDLKKRYEEPVSHFFLFLFFIFLGVKKVVSPHLPWSCEASLS